MLTWLCLSDFSIKHKANVLFLQTLTFVHFIIDHAAAALILGGALSTMAVDYFQRKRRGKYRDQTPMIYH